jgi:hypothetical protein
MKQQTLAMAVDQSESFERYRRPSRRDEFLATMDRIVDLDRARVPDGTTLLRFRRCSGRSRFLVDWMNVQFGVFEDRRLHEQLR